MPERAPGPLRHDRAVRAHPRWSKLPDHDEIELLREAFLPQSPFGVQLHEMILSRSFLEATGATSATLDFHAIPGFKSQWRQDPSVSQFHELVVIHDISATETASASASESISVTTSARGPAPATGDPGAGLRASWVAPIGPDRWRFAPRLSSPGRDLAGRP